MTFAQHYYDRQCQALSSTNFKIIKKICTDGAYLRAISDAESRKHWSLYLKIVDQQKELVYLYEQSSK